MSYPAVNNITQVTQMGGYTSSGQFNGGGAQPTVNHDTGPIVTGLHFDIHPASGNAPMLKGFKYCRAWSRTWGSIGVSGSSLYRVSRYYAPYLPTSAIDKNVTYGGATAWGYDTGTVVPATTPSLPSSNMINATLVKALNKLKAQDVHVGNFIAESHKTVEMFTHHANIISSGVRRWRKSHSSKDWDLVKKYESGGLLRHLWCLIPNSWLELQYGWIPLMSDLYGAVHHLTRSSRYQVPYVSVKAHNRNEEEFSFSKTLAAPPTAMMSPVPRSVANFLVRQDCWVNLVYGISSPVLAELSSLGLLNPLEIVWEVTRYSFVVDWFLPVSSWLSSLTGDVGFTFITGSRSSKATRTFVSSAIVGPSQGSWTFPGSTYYWSVDAPVSYNDSVGVFERVCYGSSPVPGIYVKNPLSLTHAANAMALLVQAFR